MRILSFRKNRFFFLALLESWLLFLYAPQKYDYEFNLVCLLQFVFMFVLYIYKSNKRNYLDFDVLFLITYFFVMFFFPVFMYNTEFEKLFFAFQYEYNENVISKSSALSLVGMQAYLLGSCSFAKNKVVYEKSNDCIILYKNLYPLGIFLLLLFIYLSGSDLLTHKYDGKIGGESASGAITYVLLLFTIVLYVINIIEFYNRRNSFNYQKVNYGIYLVAVFSFLFLYIGSRTLPLQFILLLLGLYSLDNPISLKKMLVLLSLGIIFFAFVGFYRTQDDSFIEEANDNFLFLIQDLVLNNRNTFMAVDYVDNNGISYGKTMLTTCMGVIPFMNNIVFSLFPISPNEAASGLIITSISLNKDSDFEVGFGTNIIADIYMSFGLYGVIILMFLLGYKIKESLYKIALENNLNAYIFYGVMVSFSVFIVRADYFIFLRPYIWGIVITYFLKKK